MKTVLHGVLQLPLVERLDLTDGVHNGWREREGKKEFFYPSYAATTYPYSKRTTPLSIHTYKHALSLSISTTQWRVGLRPRAAVARRVETDTRRTCGLRCWTASPTASVCQRRACLCWVRLLPTTYLPTSLCQLWLVGCLLLTCARPSGGTPESQREFLDTLSADTPSSLAAGPASDPSLLPRDMRRSRSAPIANQFALGYTYQDVLDADHEGE